jgi:CelD/BcsL family acetyltransferase involved in cellulose biosynthesis
MLEFEVVTDIDLLKPLRNEWDIFMESIEGEIYQTFDWFYIWWKYYGGGRKLSVILFRHENRLVGILPLFSEKIWLGPVSIRALKMAGSDFTYATFHPPLEQGYWKEAFRIVREKFLRPRIFDVFVFGPLSGTFDDQMTLLKSSITEDSPAGICVKECNTDGQTFFFLSTKIEHYLQSIGKKKQHELRRKQKIFDQVAGMENALNSRIVSGPEVPEVFEAFCRLHKAHWQKQKLPGHFESWPKAKEFHTELSRKMDQMGRLRLLEVRCGNNPVGYKYAYRFGKRLVEFMDARTLDPLFDRASVGDLVFLEQVKRAYGEGVEIIDSLFGRYEHKLKMGGKVLQARHLLIHGPWTSFRLMLFRRLAKIQDILYYKIWRYRISGWMGLARGQLWKTWIRSRIFK